MIIQNDPRRWRERADGSMVMEDHQAQANLSPNVMIRAIPHHDIPIDPSGPGDLPGYGKDNRMHEMLMSVVKGR